MENKESHHKQEKLKEAIERYPKGVSFRQISLGNLEESNGEFSIYDLNESDFAINHDGSEDFVYNSWNNEWAEVVNNRPCQAIAKALGETPIQTP